jgi:hypothetical protein
MRAFLAVALSAIGLGSCESPSMIALYEPSANFLRSPLSTPPIPMTPAPDAASRPATAGGLDTRYASPDGDVPRFHRILSSCQSQLAPRTAGLARNAEQLAAAAASRDFSQTTVRIEIPGPAATADLQGHLDRCMTKRGYLPIRD